MRAAILALPMVLAAAGGVAAAPCGGSFASFITAMKAEAIAAGHPRAKVDAFFGAARLDPVVLRADHAQGIFRKTFTEFAHTLVTKGRLRAGRAFAVNHAALLAQAERRYGVPRGILLAFLAFETDFGAVQGNFNTLDALATLGHNCERPQLFQRQLMAALTLYERGDFALNTTGAWAGEIGIVQMLPRDVLESGVDGDGDGRIRLRSSLPDALMSAANLLRRFGWQAGQPWMIEVRLPGAMDWARTGLGTRLSVAQWQAMGVRARSMRMPPGDLPASVLLPQGRKGPAFLVFDNFRVLLHWNKSLTYVTTLAYFATRMQGAPRFDPGHPDPQLSLDQMKRLQHLLVARGYDVGKVDGILGAATREAVRRVQVSLGMPADGWPTRALLGRL